MSTRKSAEKSSAFGLITLKTRTDDRYFDIDYVIDSYSGEHLSRDEAQARDVINLQKNYYVIGATGERITLDSAIKGGWIKPNYAPDEPTYDIKTYVVSEVVDQRQKKRLPFLEAVKRGLFERKTGNYVNNLSKETVYVCTRRCSPLCVRLKCYLLISFRHVN